MMRTRVWSWTVVIVLMAGVTWAAGTAGYLDTTFDGDGIALVDDPVPSAITSDDGYLAIESVAPAGSDNTQWVVYRYEADGSRDTSFGASSSGRTAPIFGDRGDDEARMVLEAPDGRILVAGSRWRAYGNGKKKKYDRDFAVACFTAGGVLDTNFGDGGVTQIDVGVGDIGYGITATGTSSSYDIYVRGWTLVSASTGGGSKKKKGGGGSTSTTSAIALLKLDDDGDLVTGFGDGGVVVDNISATLDDSASDFVVDDSGRIVVSIFQGPQRSIAAGDAIIMSRYTSSGSLDTSFATNGRMYEDSTIGRSIDLLALDADGTSLIVGKRIAAIIARYDDAGDLDAVFDTSALAVDDQVEGLHVEADGTVLAALWVGPASDYAMTVGRYLANGSPDTSFGPDADGMGEWTEVDTVDAPTDVFVRSDGKIILIGIDPAGGQTIIARYLD